MNLLDRVDAKKLKSEKTRQALDTYRKFLATYPSLKEILTNLKYPEQFIVTGTVTYDGTYLNSRHAKVIQYVTALLGVFIGFIVGYLIYA